MKITVEVLESLGFRWTAGDEYHLWNSYCTWLIKQETNPMGVSGWFLKLEDGSHELVKEVADIFAVAYHNGYDDGRKNIQKQLRDLLGSE